MPGPLTIYECPECGSLDTARTRCERPPDHDRRRAPVRVFREEDVRPLWEAACEIGGDAAMWWTARGASAAFPAPADWTDGRRQHHGSMLDRTAPQ